MIIASAQCAQLEVLTVVTVLLLATPHYNVHCTGQQLGIYKL